MEMSLVVHVRAGALLQVADSAPPCSCCSGSRRSLFAGATDVLRRFMKMEAGAASLAAAAAAAAQADSPLSTHPAAGNRLKRLEEAYRGGGAAV